MYAKLGGPAVPQNHKNHKPVTNRSQKKHRFHELFSFPPFSTPCQSGPPSNTNGHFSVSPFMRLLLAPAPAKLARMTLGAGSQFWLRHAMSNPRGHGVTEPESLVWPLRGRWGFTNHPLSQQNIIVSARSANDDTSNSVKIVSGPPISCRHLREGGRGPAPPCELVEPSKSSLIGRAPMYPSLVDLARHEDVTNDCHCWRL